MPEYMHEALEARGPMKDYRARMSRTLRGGPPYQRNDYVSWITRANGKSNCMRTKEGGVYRLTDNKRNIIPDRNGNIWAIRI